MKFLERFLKPMAIVVALIGTEKLSAQPKETFNVAVFLYDNMELLDFAGPTEVFAATRGFNVYSVSVDGQPLECNQTGKILNKITPDYSMQNAPVPDVVIFPGGGTGPISENPLVLQWVKDIAAKGTFLMSVCTGASVLANTGLLAGKNITTWYGFIPSLQSSHPELKVLENTRFVDNGIYLTTAGVSAGIDGALHLVSRIKGLDVAKATARYMEYDKWNPGQGRIDVKNEVIEQIRNQKLMEKTAFVIPEGKAVPYEGEFKNLAFELRDQNKIEDAIKVLELCVKYYPKSSASYMEIASLNKKIGKPAPENEEYYARLLQEGKYQDAVKRYENDQKQFPGWLSIRHGGRLTQLGVDQFQKGEFARAAETFQFIAITDPSYGAFYNVGETHMRMNNKKEAIANFKKSLEFKPGDEEVLKIIADLEAK